MCVVVLAEGIGNGERLLDLAIANDLVISGTWFEHPKRHVWTHQYLGTENRVTIDHVLCSKKWASSVRDVRAFGSAHLSPTATDHRLLVATLQYKLRKAPDSSKKPPVSSIVRHYASRF